MGALTILCHRSPNACVILKLVGYYCQAHILKMLNVIIVMNSSNALYLMLL